jgi:hypothetical protein
MTRMMMQFLKGFGVFTVGWMMYGFMPPTTSVTTNINLAERKDSISLESFIENFDFNNDKQDTLHTNPSIQIYDLNPNNESKLYNLLIKEDKIKGQNNYMIIIVEKEP